MEGKPIQGALRGRISRSAVETMNARTETNREKLLNLALYDLLLSMQGELDYAKAHGEAYPCIMDALGQNLVTLRCYHYHGDCSGCIAGWLAEPAV